MQILGTSFISSMFAAASALGLLHGVEFSGALTASVLVFVAVGAAEVIGGAAYLKGASKRSADEAIHPDTIRESRRGRHR